MSTEADCQSPSVIVTLVHGTFSPDAAWTHRGSSFRTELAGGLESLGQVYLRRFAWSGANNLFERVEAERALRRDVTAVHARFPDARHFIIAHSHGGNIASGLLSGGDVSGVSGLVCLATPFFHLRFREEILDPNLMARSWASILCLGAFVGFVALKPTFWIELLVIAGCVLVGGAIGAFLGGGLDVIAPPVRTFVANSAPSKRLPLLNLRGAGDEAAFALSFGQLVDWLCSALHRRIVARAGQPRATVVPGRWRVVFRFWLLCVAIASALALFITSVDGSLTAGAPWFAAVGTIAMVGAVIIKTYWLDNLALGLSSLMLVGSTVFSKGWFGTSVPDTWDSGDEVPSGALRWVATLLFSMLLEVRTEAAPPGEWGVTYLPPPPLLPDPIEGRLTHAIYDHPEARRLIIKWINDTAPPTAEAWTVP